jgi:diguanylate cyclase (GGDEF)-like protein
MLEHSLKSALGERERMAMTDILTGAFNRRYLMQHLTNELGRAQRARSELSVLLLDFDHFSHINNRYGHAAGDAALNELLKRIQNSLRRDGDWCARLGGDEFVVVLPQTDLAGAGLMAEKLLRAVEAAPICTGAGIVRITASIGASALSAVFDPDAATAELLIELADQCLYVSKKTGRGRATIPQMVDAQLRMPGTNGLATARA